MSFASCLQTSQEVDALLEFLQPLVKVRVKASNTAVWRFYTRSFFNASRLLDDHNVVFWLYFFSLCFQEVRFFSRCCLDMCLMSDCFEMWSDLVQHKLKIFGKFLFDVVRVHEVSHFCAVRSEKQLTFSFVQWFKCIHVFKRHNLCVWQNFDIFFFLILYCNAFTVQKSRA